MHYDPIHITIIGPGTDDHDNATLERINIRVFMNRSEHDLQDTSYMSPFKVLNR